MGLEGPIERQGVKQIVLRGGWKGVLREGGGVHE